MSKNTTSIFILAGEPSGDSIGADLITNISKEGEFQFFGVGGAKMQNAGFTSLYEMSDLAVMGFSDVFFRLPILLRRLSQTAKYIIKNNPDLLVLIDSQVFSAMLAKKIKKLGYKKPIILYVAPTVWAYKPQRAKKISVLFDEVLAILPFEVKAMKQLEGPLTSYVGHPALKDAPKQFSSNRKKKSVVALFPGSRVGEVKRHMPIFKDLAEKLYKQHKITKFIIPTLCHLQDNLNEQVKTWEVPVEIIIDKQEKLKQLNNVKLAVVSVGTITLELALTGIPMVGTYIPDSLQMAYYKKAGMPMLALPNILLQKKVIPEIMPDKDLLDNMAIAIGELLANNISYDAQITAFSKIRVLMQKGEVNAIRQDPSSRILSHLSK